MPYKLLPASPQPTTSLMQETYRVPAQIAVGAAATVPGIFGDILSLPYAGINKLTTLMGGKNVPYEQSIIGKSIPTTATHIKQIEEVIPSLKPKNEFEKFTRDVSSDTVSLFMPGGFIKKAAGLRGAGLVKSGLVSLGANTAGEIVSDWTGDPKKGAYAKMGIMFLGSSLNKPGIKQEIGEIYNKADTLLPKTATVKATKLEKNLNDLKDKILVGRNVKDLADSEKFVIDQSNIILRQIKNGEVNVGTLKAALRSLNENLQKAIYEAPDKATKIRARSLAKNINYYTKDALADYGKINPEWWKLEKGANDATAALHQSNVISNFIENNLIGHPATHGLIHALGGISETATSAMLPYEAGKILYRMWKSPVLRKHYGRVISSAAAENAPLMNKEIKKLDSELQKEFKNKPKYRLLD